MNGKYAPAKGIAVIFRLGAQHGLGFHVEASST